MDGLPSQFPAKDHIHQCGCWICPREVGVCNNPHDITLHTYYIFPGQLLHIEFYFVNVVSISVFTAVLMILDVKTRKNGQFPTIQN